MRALRDAERGGSPTSSSVIPWSTRRCSRALGIPASNIYRSLAPLLEADVLRETRDRRRGRTWRSVEVIAALDAFAARAGRRTATQGA